jgi:hypothetical protein
MASYNLRYVNNGYSGFTTSTARAHISAQVVFRVRSSCALPYSIYPLPSNSPRVCAVESDGLAAGQSLEAVLRMTYDESAK